MGTATLNGHVLIISDGFGEVISHYSGSLESLQQDKKVREKAQEHISSMFKHNHYIVQVVEMPNNETEITFNKTE